MLYSYDVPQIPNEPPVLGHSIPVTRCTSHGVNSETPHAKGSSGLESWSMTFQDSEERIYMKIQPVAVSKVLLEAFVLRILFLDSTGLRELFFLRRFWSHVTHFPQVRHLGACYLAPSMHRIPDGQEMLRTKTKWPSYDPKTGGLFASQTCLKICSSASKSSGFRLLRCRCLLGRSSAALLSTSHLIALWIPGQNFGKSVETRDFVVLRCVFSCVLYIFKQLYHHL